MRTNRLNNLKINGLHNDTAIYEDSVFIGFMLPEAVEEHMEEYRAAALELVERETCDKVVIYAVLEYDDAGGALLSADFMCRSVPYQKYTELALKLLHSCRLFFFRGRKESDNE